MVLNLSAEKKQNIEAVVKKFYARPDIGLSDITEEIKP